MTSPHVSTPRRIARVTIGAAALVPPTVLAVAVATHARNLPWWDQWGLAAFMIEGAQGRFSPSMLWTQVNEHRVPVALLLQGAIAWCTRWDVRADAWATVAVAMGSLAVLTALARRSLDRAGAPAVTLACSLLVFSPIVGASWTAHWLTPAFLAAFFACVLAWLVVGSTGTWLRLTGMILTACAGALSFGSGTVLVGLLPLTVLLRPVGSLARRALHALLALAVGLALARAYLLGWHPRPGAPPTVLHPERMGDYVAFALAFVGAPIGARPRSTATAWGTGLAGVWAAGSCWLWARRPELRRALVAWGVLALYGLGNGVVTAFGRLDNGLNIAIRPRYAPTAGLFVASTAAVATLVVADMRARSRPASWVARIALLVAVVVIARTFADAARHGFADMAKVAERLDSRAACMRSCMTAPETCFAPLCWNPMLARRLCVHLKLARIGPFRSDAPPARADTSK